MQKLYEKVVKSEEKWELEENLQLFFDCVMSEMARRDKDLEDLRKDVELFRSLIETIVEPPEAPDSESNLSTYSSAD